MTLMPLLFIFNFFVAKITQPFLLTNLRDTNLLSTLGINLLLNILCKFNRDSFKLFLVYAMLTNASRQKLPTLVVYLDFHLIAKHINVLDGHNVSPFQMVCSALRITTSCALSLVPA